MDYKKTYTVEQMKANYLYRKWKQTGKMMYAIMLNQLTGEGDLTAGKHHS